VLIRPFLLQPEYTCGALRPPLIAVGVFDERGYTRKSLCRRRGIAAPSKQALFQRNVVLYKMYNFRSDFQTHSPIVQASIDRQCRRGLMLDIIIINLQYDMQ